MRFSWFWRLLAALALLSFVALLTIVLNLILAGPLLAGLALTSVVCLGCADWLIFSGRHRRLWYGWGLLLSSLAGLLVVLAALRRGQFGGELAAVISAGVVYVWLAGLLRREYWRQRRHRATSTERPQQPVLIVNPKSGNGRAMKTGLIERARQRGITVVVTKQGESIEALANQAVAAGADVLGVSGGDGTLGAVAAVARVHQLPLVVLPGGTRCHFARDIGLEPKRIIDALEGFWGVRRMVDVGYIGDRLFLNNVSFGLYADIVDHPDYRAHKLARTRLVIQEILDQTRPMYDLIFTDDTGRRYDRAVQLLVGMNPYQTMHLFELGRRESLDAGVLQVIAVTRLDDATLRRLGERIALGKSAVTGDSANILSWQTTSFTVSSEADRLVVGVDGEREVYSTPVHVKLLPRALTLLVPPEGVRSRPTTVASRLMLVRLWRVAVQGRLE